MSLLKQLLKYESYLVTEYRSKDIFCVRPSIVVSILLYILYLISPLDIFLKGDMLVSGIGLFIDLVLLCLVSLYFYSDLGGMKVGKIRWENIFKQNEYSKEDDVPKGNGHVNKFVDISSTINSSSDSGNDKPNYRVDSLHIVNDDRDTISDGLDTGIEITEEFVEDEEGDRL